MSSSTPPEISRETQPAELSERGAPVPMWLIVLLFLLLFWGAVYFDENGGWFSPRVYAPYQSVAEVRELQPSTGAADMFELGKAVYNRPTCVACHQANGQGTAGQFPPLAESEWVLEPEPGRLIRMVIYGVQGPMTVKGQPYNNVMVPWGLAPPPGGLTDQEIAAVLTYVRQNQDWGNNAPAVTAEQVKAVREKVGTRTAPFTAQELLSISPAE